MQLHFLRFFARVNPALPDVCFVLIMSNNIVKKIRQIA